MAIQGTLLRHKRKKILAEELTVTGTASLAGASLTGSVSLGDAAADLVGMHGSSASQRAASIQASSFVSVSSNITVGSNLAAFCAEVAATLTTKGVWKGSA